METKYIHQLGGYVDPSREENNLPVMCVVVPHVSGTAAAGPHTGDMPEISENTKLSCV